MRLRTAAGPGRMVLGGTTLLALSLLAGCGFLGELADPPVTPEPTAAAPAAPDLPEGPRVVAAAQLADDRVLPGSPFPATLQVQVHPVAPQHRLLLPRAGQHRHLDVDGRVPRPARLALR